MVLSPLDGILKVDYKISQGFGENPQYYNKYGHNGHNGYDLAPLFKARKYIVRAPHDGYVRTKNDGNKGYGMYVEIIGMPHKKDGIGMKSDLAHLQQFLVSDGQYIAQGDPIGILGNTGDSTGPHTHWTYKLIDSLGNTINKANGKNGAIDVGQYVIASWKSSLNFKS